MDKDLLTRFKAVAQGPDAAWVREFLDRLSYRHEEFATEPLSSQEQAAVKEGREALRRGIGHILPLGRK